MYLVPFIQKQTFGKTIIISVSLVIKNQLETGVILLVRMSSKYEYSLRTHVLVRLTIHLTKCAHCLWTVKTPDNYVIPFKKDICKCHGFPYIEMSVLATLALLQSVAKIETVQANYEGFARQEVTKAVLACKAHAIVGSPSNLQFAELVSKNCTALKTVPVTCSDLTNARTIFGLGLSVVRRKHVR